MQAGELTAEHDLVGRQLLADRSPVLPLHLPMMSYRWTAERPHGRVRPDYAFGRFDPETARYAGAHEGTSVRVASGAGGITHCLIAVAEDPENWVVGCESGGSGGGLEIDGIAGGFALRADSEPIADAAVEVGPNVVALD